MDGKRKRAASSVPGLPLALAAARSGSLDRVRAVIAQHDDLRLVHADDDDYTLLHALCQHNFPQLVALLLEKGLGGGDSRRECVNVQDRWGVSPLMLAACNGNGECALLLLRNGADVTLADCKGVRAEDWARRYHHRVIVAAIEQERRKSPVKS